jgi:hypothetical protein
MSDASSSITIAISGSLAALASDWFSTLFASEVFFLHAQNPNSRGQLITPQMYSTPINIPNSIHSTRIGFFQWK